MGPACGRGARRCSKTTASASSPVSPFDRCELTRRRPRHDSPAAGIPWNTFHLFRFSSLPRRCRLTAGPERRMLRSDDTDARREARRCFGRSGPTCAAERPRSAAGGAGGLPGMRRSLGPAGQVRRLVRPHLSPRSCRPRRPPPCHGAMAVSSMPWAET
jgi:hypothetical protein